MFRTPTIDQLTGFIQPTWQALIDGAMFSHDHLTEIIARQQPDVIIEDNVNSFPALVTAGVPFVRSVSCQPLEMSGADVPPTFSGLPSDDRSQWADFRAEYERTHREMWGELRRLGAVGAARRPCDDLEFVHDGRPEPVPLPRGRRLHRPPATGHQRGTASIHRCGPPMRRSTCRSNCAPTTRPSHLVYLSLGSLGSADVELMRRLVSVLGRTRHRFIVSKGPLADDYDLPSNMWGDAQVPQTNVLPLVDLVITHGGNNTTTEAFHFGKPMIVLPLFWDQYDNAQRVHELGFGQRLDTYGFADDELIDAVDRLLADDDLHRRMAANGEVIRGRRGTQMAAELIEALAR